VARLGAALGMRVVGCSRRPSDLDGLAAWYPSPEFGAFLAEADFVVLALPATAETRHIVRRETLARMRPGAWLLNISRGSLVDEAALLEGLRRGQPAGAVLDVFEREPLAPDHPFWEMPNVIVTSHQSGAVVPEEVVALFAENLPRYRQADRLLNEVDPEWGY
jgi:phosphoglycerate dehydrogenase-like enzyme